MKKTTGIIAIILAVLAGIYVISPIDALPGPVDDALVTGLTAIIDLIILNVPGIYQKMKASKSNFKEIP